MKRIRRIVFTLIGIFASAGLPVSAEISASAAATKAPFIEGGVVVGRDGAAFGPGIFAQINMSRFGVYGFAGRSNVNDYAAGHGITAKFSDNTLGLGFVCRVVEIHGFVIGGFAQAAYYGSHVRATYFDPDYSVSVEYRESDRDPLVTIGPEISRQIAHGIFLVVRPGKDFGNNFAATTANGFSVNGGVLVDAISTGKSVGNGFKRLLH